jgi:hypothetical protein
MEGLMELWGRLFRMILSQSLLVIRMMNEDEDDEDELFG